MKTIIAKSLTALTILTAAALTACTDAVPSEDFGPSPEANTDGVFFYSANTAIMAKAKTDTLRFAIGRAKTAAAQSYHLTTSATDSAGNDARNNIIIPETVTFAAGQDVDSISIIIKDIDYDCDYTVEMSLGDEAATPYANSTHKFTVKCEDPDAWELFTSKAVFVNNFWSSILSGSTTMYKNVKVKKYKGRDIFRIYDLPATFRAEWTEYYQLAPDCELTVDPETYPIELDCEKYSDPKARVKKLFMPFQSLGVKLGTLEGMTTAGEIFAGSVAYNLQSAATGEPISEAMYPIGTYDTKTGVMAFGNIATDFSDEIVGIRLCQSQTYLYLDENNVEQDIQNMLYKNLYRATFNSTAYLDESGQYMSQGTKIARCIDEDYEDAPYTYRISAPYTANHDLYFTHKNGRVKFLDNQMTGSTALGGYPIMCEAKTATYTETAEKKAYNFEMVFYYTNDKSERYNLGTFHEELVVGSEISYFSAADLVPGKSIDDYVGKWKGDFTYVSDQNTGITSEVTISKDDDYTLIIRGLSPYMESNYGYDSSLYLEWNDETGVFDFFPQYANTFNQYQINVYMGNLDDPAGELYDNQSLRVGLLKDGRMAFVNNPDNDYEVNCAVFYTPASGGALVEPFIPYNLVLTRVEDTQAKPNYPKNVQTMIPCRHPSQVRGNNNKSYGHPAFTMGSGTVGGVKLKLGKALDLNRK